jgi:hypothetical protein
MRIRPISSICLSAAVALAVVAAQPAPKQDWTNFVRIGAYGLNHPNVDKIIADVQKNHVFGIEVDNDIPGRYESFLDPTEKLTNIKAMATAAHKINNRAFVYIAGTECITAHGDKVPHTLFKDHPDWVQRNKEGAPASFTGGAAFWIRPGDEDVWVSPYATEWRKTYMERVRQIAATGIDGIYVDIPYWMTHFDGWENTWASFDDYSVAAFKEQTGLDAKKDVKLGDYSDPNFRKWITFRIDTMTEFMRDIRDNARTVSPDIKVIPEIYPGIEAEAPRVGADVYEMYPIVDAIAHEYEFGEGDHMASGRFLLDWFFYQAGMLSFRSFAAGKATWILNYSWDGDKGVVPAEAMRTLAASQITVGANFWDAPGHSMAGSNDAATRAQIFAWIEKHEKTFYLPRTPIHPIGVYFSPASRNFDAGHFLPSYRAALVLLLQNHLELQVVTPRNLAQFHGASLILPNVSILDDAEQSALQSYTSGGGHVLILGVDSTKSLPASHVTRLADSPESAYLKALQADFAAGSQHPPKAFLGAVTPDKDLVVTAPPLVSSNVATVDGKPHIFLVNFNGIVPHKNLIPTPESSVTIKIRSTGNRTLHFLPFLGEEKTVSPQRQGDSLVFSVPSFERAAALWLEDAP